jgi:hypothetical protein
MHRFREQAAARLQRGILAWTVARGRLARAASLLDCASTAPAASAMPALKTAARQTAPIRRAASGRSIYFFTLTL